MDLHLFLFQTDYKLIVHQKVPEENPPPVGEGDDKSTGGDTDTGNGNDGGTAEGDHENADEDDDDGVGDDEGGDQEDDSDEDKRDQKKGDDDKKGKDEKKNKKNDNDKDHKDKNDDDDDHDDDGDDDRISGNELNGTVDLDDFFQHAKPSLVVFATWAFNGENITIIFAVTDVKRITIRAMQHNRSQILIDDHGQGTVNFDPERWFQSISSTDLQNASLQTYQGQPVMFIHRDINAPLFETLMTNLTSSTTFEVVTPSAP